MSGLYAMNSKPSPSSKELGDDMVRRVFKFNRAKLDEVRDHFEMKVDDAMNHEELHFRVVGKIYDCSRDELLALRDFIESTEFGLGKTPSAPFGQLVQRDDRGSSNADNGEQA